MTLDQLREKALYQNTIDVWISYCDERGWDWYSIENYRKFINHLGARGIKMQKFPLCVKESGGTYERGRDKTQFLEELSKLSTEDAAAFTLKLSGNVVATIRAFAN